MIFESLPLILLITAFVMTIIEYILLRKMITFYYKNGPFAFKGSYKLITTKEFVGRSRYAADNLGKSSLFIGNILFV